MVKKSLYLCILLALGLQWAIPSSAQEAQLTTVSFPKAAAFTSLSDNGLWATAAGVNDDDQSKYAYPYLINVETGALTELWVEADLIKSLEATDVTNDGKIIVGTYDSKPAYYDMNQGKWITLQSENPGKATSVTPDGKYISGWSNSDSFSGDAYVETPLLWEKQSDGTYRAIDVYAELPNFPKKTKLGTNTQQVRIDNVSPDGNILSGIINFVTPATVCTSLNLVAFKGSFPYGVPCFLIMQKTSFHVAKGHVLQRESMPFALLKDVFCVAGLILLPEPLWRYGHDNTIRHTIQRFFRQTGVSFCGLSARRARCA